MNHLQRQLKQKTHTTNPNPKNSNHQNNINITMFFKEKPEQDGISLCESYLSKMRTLVSELPNNI